ncbi:MAG: polyphosphate kinase 2 family protein [Chthoniobacterales bacterium]
MSQEKINLDALEQEISLTQETYKKRLKKYQLKLLEAQLILREKKSSCIIVMEGPDAAGKGGAIKRITERLDPRLVRVYSIVKPTPEEYQHHYLWRFWQKLPPYGSMAIFDRSWYGRLLVERVEKFATEKEWKRAYDEINSFEKLLTDDGHVIVKLFIQVTKKEQLIRFQRRAGDPYKHWKINDEDWRNRDKWQEHNKAAEDMFARTSLPHSRWKIIAGNYKWHARVEAVKAVYKALAPVVGMS